MQKDVNSKEIIRQYRYTIWYYPQQDFQEFLTKIYSVYYRIGMNNEYFQTNLKFLDKDISYTDKTAPHTTDPDHKRG